MTARACRLLGQRTAVAASSHQRRLAFRRLCSATDTSAKTEPAEDVPVQRYSRDGSRFYRVPNPARSGSTLEYPSVTTVLGGLWTSGLVPWATRMCADQVERDLFQQRRSGRLERVLADEKQFAAWVKKLKRRGMGAPNEIRDSAGRLGTVCHAVIERMVRNEEVEHDELLAEQLDESRTVFQAKNVIAGFQKWRESSPFLLYPDTEKTLWSHKYEYAGAADAIGVDQSDDSLVMLDFKTSNRVTNSHALQVVAYAKAYEEMTGEAVDRACIVHLRKESSTFTVYTVKDIDITFKAFRAALFLWKANNEILMEATDDSNAI